MKNLFFAIAMVGLPFLSSCNLDEELEKTFEEDPNVVRCSVSFENVDFSQLQSEDDTLKISLVPEYVGGNQSLLRADVTEVQGTVTKTNVKTWWTYGKGENLIPNYVCGQYTISERYDMTVTVIVGPGKLAVKDETRQWVGWRIENIGNPQVRYINEIPNSTTGSTEFRTCVWHVVSNMGGVNYPNVWGPFNDPTKARIYYKIYREE